VPFASLVSTGEKLLRPELTAGFIHDDKPDSVSLRQVLHGAVYRVRHYPGMWLRSRKQAVVCRVSDSDSLPELPSINGDRHRNERSCDDAPDDPNYKIHVLTGYCLSGSIFRRLGCMGMSFSYLATAIPRQSSRRIAESWRLQSSRLLTENCSQLRRKPHVLSDGGNSPRLFYEKAGLCQLKSRKIFGTEAAQPRDPIPPY
jgi:hypothetical protein